MHFHSRKCMWKCRLRKDVHFVSASMWWDTGHVITQPHWVCSQLKHNHYNDVIMSATASQITSLTSVYSTDYSVADQRKHQSSASLAFVRDNSPATGEFPAQRASNAVNVSIWWRHHGWDSPETHREAYAIMVVADVIALNMHQAISNHQAVIPATTDYENSHYATYISHNKHTLQWRHNGHDSVSNHQRLYCLLNCFYGHRSSKTSKLCVTGLCEGNSPGTGEFPAQMATNAENVPIWWHRHKKNNAREMSGGRQPVGSFVVGGFIFSERWRLTHVNHLSCSLCWIKSLF